jgi:hypothetical protein
MYHGIDITEESFYLAGPSFALKAILRQSGFIYSFKGERPVSDRIAAAGDFTP